MKFSQVIKIKQALILLQLWYKIISQARDTPVFCIYLIKIIIQVLSLNFSNKIQMEIERIRMVRKQHEFFEQQKTWLPEPVFVPKYSASSPLKSAD